MVESSSDDILRGAKEVDVAFLVVGDPFGYVASMRFRLFYYPLLLTKCYCRATTHTDLVLRARELQIPTRSIPNASILNAIGCTGLQLYNFGQTVSMVFFTDTWKPSSFYDRIKENVQIGLHTLVLLDIKVKEQSLENMARGRKIYEPPRYMTVAQCAQQMLETEQERKEGVYEQTSLAIGVARVGAVDLKIVVGTLKELCEVDLGRPLHSLVLLGRRTHDLEREYIEEYAISKETFRESWEKSYGKSS